MAAMRRGTGMRSKIASAATASGGDTIAPNVNANGQLKPGMTACTATATTTVVKMTSPKASSDIGRQLRLSSSQSVAHAALYSSGGSRMSKTISGSKCGCGRLRAKASAIPPITNETGNGIFRRLAVTLSTITMLKNVTRISASFIGDRFPLLPYFGAGRLCVPPCRSDAYGRQHREYRSRRSTRAAYDERRLPVGDRSTRRRTALPHQFVCVAVRVEDLAGSLLETRRRRRRAPRRFARVLRTRHAHRVAGYLGRPHDRRLRHDTVGIARRPGPTDSFVRRRTIFRWDDANDDWLGRYRGPHCGNPFLLRRCRRNGSWLLRGADGVFVRLDRLLSSSRNL